MAGSNKEHVKKIKKSEFNRQRAETSVLRANCKDGYIFSKIQIIKRGPKKGETYTSASGQMEFHHALPISSMQDGEIKYKESEELDFIHNCMATTKWDINENENLIGLPTKKPYEAADRLLASNYGFSDLIMLSASSGQFGALPDLPCHLNEHPEYTMEVIKYLNDTIWKRLKRERKKCENKGKSIAKELNDASKHWKDFLVARGAGAADCWINREKPSYKNKWYIPFSMNPNTPRKVLPPPNIHKRSASIRNWLNNLFA